MPGDFVKITDNGRSFFVRLSPNKGDLGINRTFKLNETMLVLAKIVKIHTWCCVLMSPSGVGWAQSDWLAKV